MTYLLDVNALIAWGVRKHEFHNRVKVWLGRQGSPPLATCSVTELGFVRILAQIPHYGFDLLSARSLLLELKRRPGTQHVFLPDGNDIANLPSFVKHHRYVTDGHLLGLAHAHNVLFATLDEGIPGASFIPRLP